MVILIQLLLSQLVCYGIAWWAAFVAIAFTASWFLRLPGIFLGHLVIAALVAVLDIRWIEAEIHAPGWNGQPDMDIVFIFGVFLRIVLINTILLPVSLMARRLTNGTVPAP